MSYGIFHRLEGGGGSINDQPIFFVTGSRMTAGASVHGSSVNLRLHCWPILPHSSVGVDASDLNMMAHMEGTTTTTTTTTTTKLFHRLVLSFNIHQPLTVWIHIFNTVMGLSKDVRGGRLDAMLIGRGHSIGKDSESMPPSPIQSPVKHA